MDQPQLLHSVNGRSEVRSQGQGRVYGCDCACPPGTCGGSVVGWRAGPDETAEPHAVVQHPCGRHTGHGLLSRETCLVRLGRSIRRTVHFSAIVPAFCARCSTCADRWQGVRCRRTQLCWRAAVARPGRVHDVCVATYRFLYQPSMLSLFLFPLSSFLFPPSVFPFSINNSYWPVHQIQVDVVGP